MREYKSYKDYPMGEWQWPNFTPRELRSKGDGKLMVDREALGRLQALRLHLNKPLVIVSAYRSYQHNKNIGGAKHSQHLKAKAFDVTMNGQDPAEFEYAARLIGFTGFGFYKDSNFIHIDTGPARSWGSRWFKRKEPKETRKL